MKVFLRLCSWGQRLLLAVLVAAVLVVAGARLLVASLPLLQQQITHVLSNQLDTSLQVDHLHAEWRGGVPMLTVRGLTLQGYKAVHPGLAIDRFDLSLNLRATLLRFTPVFHSLEINGISLDIKENSNGEWALSGIDGIGSHRFSQDLKGKPGLLDWLQYQGQISITNSTLIVRRLEGEAVTLRAPAFSLANEKGLKRLGSRFELGAGSIEISGLGGGTDSRSLGWKGRVSINDFDIELLCVLSQSCKDRIQTIMAASELDWLYQKGQWQVSGDINVPEVAYFTDASSDSSRSLKGASSIFIKGIKGKGWKLWLNNLSVAVDDGEPVVTDWFVKGEKSPFYSITIASESLVLEDLRQLLQTSELMPGMTGELLRTLNPKGQVNNLAMRIYPERQPFDFDLSAELTDVSVDAWEGAPSAAHVSGELRMNRLQGRFNLASDAFELAFPHIFREAWSYSSAQSVLYWGVVDNTYTLRSNNIQLIGPEGLLRGKLRLDVPLYKAPLKMALTVGIHDGEAEQAKKYIPGKLEGLSPELESWLDDSISQADIHSGGFLYNGALKDVGVDYDSRWGLYFNVENAQLDYHKDWPEVQQLKGDVYVNDDRVEVFGHYAEMLDAQLNNATARVGLTHDPVVEVAGDLSAQGDTVSQFLIKTPINQLMDKKAEKIALSGGLDARVQLRIPLKEVNNSEVDIDGVVDNYQLTVPDYNIVINHLRGNVAYSTESGFSSTGLKGTFLEQPVEATVDTQMEGKVPQETHIQWRGIASTQALEQFFQLDALSLMDGQADYSADLKINNQARELSLRLHSDLEGVGVQLPEPLEKSPERALPLSLEYNLGPDSSVLSVDLDGIGKGRVYLDENNSIAKASLLLGETLGKDDPVPEAGETRIQVTGTLPELNIELWYERFLHQPASAKERSVSGLLSVNNLKIGRLRYKDKVLESLSVSLQPESQSLLLTVDSQPIKGRLWIPEQESVPYRLSIDHLVMPPAPSEKKAEKAKEQPILSLHPESLPAADVSIQSLTAGKMKGGQLEFKLRKSPDGARFESIQGHFSDMHLTGAADWVERQGKQASYFHGTLQGEGVDKLQKIFDIMPFVEAKDSRLDGSLEWSGTPLDLDFKALKGTIAIEMDDGKLKKLEGGAGALKLFGILSTESLMRRLKLDFSDLYASGLSFDDLDGILRFNKGVVTFDEPIVIEGPSSNFKLDGVVDAVKETMDVSMVVTLPVTSNLPIFSVLLGAAPQVAGIIYLADKLVGKQVDQLASIRYRINGAFDNPDVSLDKLFSNKAKKPKAKARSDGK